MNTTAYCKDKSGKLMKFEIDNVNNFEEAIDVVKQETRSRRVLCVVHTAEKQEQVA